MNKAEARTLLGVSAGADPAEVRAAFRRRLIRAHPDVVPDDPHAARETGRLVEAYAVLRRSPPPPAAAPPPPDDAGRVPVDLGEPRPAALVTVSGDSLIYAGPPEEVFRRLVEVADGIGDITYLDHRARLLDTVVVVGDVACSLLATLQGRASGTEVFFTLEPLGGAPRPAVEPVVAVVAAMLAGDDLV